MSVNFLSKFRHKSGSDAKVLVNGQKHQYNWLAAIVLPVWVLIGFGLAQLSMVVVFYLLSNLGVSFAMVDTSILNIIMALLVYSLSLVFVIGVPLWVRKYHTTKYDLGMSRLVSWTDIGLAPAGFIVYSLCAMLLIYGIRQLFPEFNASQVQETGFGSLSHYYEYLIAFITLIIISPIAEEILFRGYLYGKLRKYIPVWLAVILTSVIFGLVHRQWNVAIDVFALSVILCSLREITGNIWAGVLLHMIKNGVAFYILFLYPVISHTIGG